MIEQIWKLSKVQLCNLYGFNEVRYTKDKGKRGRYIVLASVWLMLIIMLIGYIGILSAVFVKMGIAEIIPVYLYTLSSIIILMFSFFKAGSIIFDMNTYEQMISLPVKKSAIIISRFLTMYVTNLSMGIIIMLPGTVMFGIFAKPGALFYMFSLFGILFLPLIPVSIASAFGALITAISARMKSKSIVASFLYIFLCLLWVVFSSVFSEGASKMTKEALQNLSVIISDKISKIYPPAVWYSKAVVSGNIFIFLLLLMVSAAIFIILTYILQHYFISISAALNATSAKNNYRMQSLKSSSILKALWKKEIKRYFASSIYVTNTIIGHILMTIMCISLFIMGPEKVENMMQIPHITSKILPFLMGFLCVIAPMTACSISLEGKQWTMTKSLPLSNKDLLTSKILTNLTIALPFYLVSVLFAILAVKPIFFDAVWIILIPAVYIVLSTEVGLTVNLQFPVFNWENEVRVVKQGISMLLTLLIGLCAVGIPFLILLFIILNKQNTDYMCNGVMSFVFIFSIIISIFLHQKNNKKNLIRVGSE